MTINELNNLNPSEFIKTLASIYEHSPWVAETVGNLKPFKNIAALQAAMQEAVQNAGQTKQLALIRAHPDLGAKLKMSSESVSEQSGVGLDKLSAELFARFTILNTTYRQRFGFPFIVAVRNHTRESILENFESRILNSPEQEKVAALEEIGEIARFRLEDLLREHN